MHSAPTPNGVSTLSRPAIEDDPKGHPEGARPKGVTPSSGGGVKEGPRKPWFL